MSASLRSLSDSDILARVRDLAARERSLTLSLLLHLDEIERRKLHLEQGYSSMFDYCTSGLGYSEPAAMRRIMTARCVARFPEIYGLLETNELTLSSVARVSRVLTAANKDVLLARIRRRSHREVEAVVAEYQPRARLREVVRPVVVRVPDALASLGSHACADTDAAAATDRADAMAIRSSAAVANTSADVGVVNASVEMMARATAEVDTVASLSGSACEKTAYLRREGDFDPTGLAGPFEKRIQFQFSASEEFQKKLDRIRLLAWHRLPANPSLEQTFELALDCFIEKHDPSLRRERRARKAKTSATQGNAKAGASRATKAGRHLAAATRDDVFTRDGGRCCYVGANGKRCASRMAIQVDHIKPVARGGASTTDNLRLLCAYHNRLESERLMGPFTRHGKGDRPV